MTKRITLQGVANSVGHSFTSLMNFIGDDYTLGHIVQAAWRSGATTLRVDLRTGRIDESPLATPKVLSILEHYIQWFPRQVERMNSSMDFVAEAELLVLVDPTRRRRVRETALFKSPYSCRVSIIDDRGKEYAYEVSDWWFPESIPVGSPREERSTPNNSLNRTASQSETRPAAG